MQAMKKSLYLAVALVLGAACGRDNGQQGQPDGGYGAYRLALVGNPVLTLHPNDKRTLQVALAQDQIGGVANADVAFEFQDGDPANAQIDVDTTKTDSDGVATIHFTAGNNSAQGFKLVATAPKYPDALPVAFSVRVIPVQRLLQIVGGPQVVVKQTGDAATVTMYTSSSIGLKVRELDKDTGQPIGGDTLTFTLPNSSPSQFSSSSNPKQATAVTNAGGEAQVFLISSAAPEPNVLITGQTASAGAQNTVTYTVNVTPSSTGQVCTSSQQCPAGTVCVNGHCTTDQGGSTCGSGTDNPCPFGYVCVNGVCQPPTQYCDPNNPNSCPSGQHCACTNPADPSTCTCIDDCPVQCPQGQVCNPDTHTCQGNGPGGPDVTGVWYTKHTYDIRQALPKALQYIFDAIRIIDQLIVGKLTWPSWVPSWVAAYLNKLISSILKQYIPSWVQTIIRIADDIATILSTLRAEGAMRLQKGVDYAHVKGSEVWTSLVFYWLGLCGDNIGGDYDTPPDCARFDVATSDNDNPGEAQQCKGQSIPSISVKVGPITGAVSGDGSAGSPYKFAVDQRQVQLNMGKVVLIVVNELLTLTTPYHCIDEATDCNSGECLVDCAGLGQDLADLVGIPDIASIVEGICDEAVTAAGQEVTKLLAGITFDTDALDFNGGSTITGGTDTTVCDSHTQCADKLGHDDFDVKLHKDVNNRDGLWTGSFFYKVIKNMPGAWEGTRTPAN
jgi:hypothetical protein